MVAYHRTLNLVPFPISAPFSRVYRESETAPGVLSGMKHGKDANCDFGTRSEPGSGIWMVGFLVDLRKPIF